MKISYLWLTLVLLTAASSAQDFKGDWQATVQESGKPMRYVLHIKKTDQGFAAAVDVPVTFLFDKLSTSSRWITALCNFVKDK